MQCARTLAFELEALNVGGPVFVALAPSSLFECSSHARAEERVQCTGDWAGRAFMYLG